MEDKLSIGIAFNFVFGLCNKKCVHCIQPERIPLHESDVLFTLENLKKFVSLNQQDVEIYSVNLGMTGENLLNPEIFDCVSYLHKNNWKLSSFATNLSTDLTDEQLKIISLFEYVVVNFSSYKQEQNILNKTMLNYNRLNEIIKTNNYSTTLVPLRVYNPKQDDSPFEMMEHKVDIFSKDQIENEYSRAKYNDFVLRHEIIMNEQTLKNENISFYDNSTTQTCEPGWVSIFGSGSVKFCEYTFPTIDENGNIIELTNAFETRLLDLLKTERAKEMIERVHSKTNSYLCRKCEGRLTSTNPTMELL